MSPNKKLTFLVAPCNEAGHLNACTGSGQALLARGHRVIFVINEAWAGNPKSFGFEEITYAGAEAGSAANPVEKLAKALEEYHIIGPESPREKLININRFFKSGNFEKKMAPMNVAMGQAIEKYKPNAVIIDDHALAPAVHFSNVPWIKSVSMGSLFEVFNPELPPGGSGYPSNSPNRSDWPELNELRRALFYSTAYNDYVESLGHPRYPDNRVFPSTEILTIYACPDELNYPQIRDSDWFNLESFHLKAPNANFKLGDILPEGFLKDDLDDKWSGKWIYLGLGSMGSVDLGLMRRLVEVLSKTSHKYIISKGPRHDQLTLARNQWGQLFLPQTNIVQHMDLVITHGGNNSFTETFALGKPMIVLPLFADQLGNAQRLHELGYGVRLDPYHFEDKQMTDAIEQLLNDQVLKVKVKAAADRIKKSTAHEQLVDKIEQLLA